LLSCLNHIDLWNPPYDSKHYPAFYNYNLSENLPYSFFPTREPTQQVRHEKGLYHCVSTILFFPT
jgi:hypothetical protein